MKSSLFILFFFLVSNILLSQCYKDNAYNVGANYVNTIPFTWHNYRDQKVYTLRHSDLNRNDDVYNISSTIVYTPPILVPPVSQILTYDLNYPKLHINDDITNTYRDLKFDRKGKMRIFSNTSFSATDYALTGSIQDSMMSNTNPSFPIGKMDGLIKMTDKNGFINNDYRTSNMIKSIQDGDVILKIIEKNGFYYACGYKIINDVPSLAERVGILYIIDKTLINSSTTSINCNTSGVKLFGIASIVSDVLVENDGTIIVAGSEDKPVPLNIHYGFIATIDLNTNNFNFLPIQPNPIHPSPANNNSVYINHLMKGNAPNEYYAIYNAKGTQTPYVKSGIIKFDLSLNIYYAHSFNIDFGPTNVNPPLIPVGWVDVSLTNMDIDASDNIFIGGYVKDMNCGLTSSVPCDYKHFSFMFHDPRIYSPPPGVNPWLIFGYKDMGFVNMDLDLFSRNGNPVNSYNFQNKMPRTVVLDPILDTLHIAFLQDITTTNHKALIQHYQRPKDFYINQKFDDCSAIPCSKDTFLAQIDTPFLTFLPIDIINFSIGQGFTEYRGTGTIWLNYANSCNINMEPGSVSYWHDEFPVLCKDSVIDTVDNCEFWSHIYTFSGSDTLCKNMVDTLYVHHYSPFGVNTYAWYEKLSPNTIISTDWKCPITKGGDYVVICTRTLSDGSTCTKTFERTIHDPLDVSIIKTPNTTLLCQGGQIILEANPITPNTPPSQPFYSYLWNNGTPVEVNILSTIGTYTVTVTFDNGCVDEESVTITTGAPYISQSFSKTQGHTIGENFTMTVNVMSTSGQPHTVPLEVTIPEGYSVLPSTTGWTITTGAGNTTKLNRIVSITTNPYSQDFLIYLKADKPCYGEVTTTSTMTNTACPTPPTALSTILNSGDRLNVAIVPPSPSSCQVPTTKLSVVNNVATSANTIIYKWTKLPSTTVIGTSKDYQPVYSSVSPEVYQAEVRQGNCIANPVICTLTYKTNPPLISSNVVSKRCQNAANGKIVTTISGGNPPYKFYLNNVLKASGITAMSYEYLGLDAGTYTIKLEDADGCTDSKIVVIEAHTYVPTFTHTITNPACSTANGSIIMSPSPSSNPGIASISYQNITTSTTINSSSSSSVNNLVSGIYNITVSDINGCSQIYKEIILNNTPPLQIDIYQQKNCVGDQIADAVITPVCSTCTYDWRFMQSPTSNMFNLYGPSINLTPYQGFGAFLLIVSNGTCKYYKIFTEETGITTINLNAGNISANSTPLVYENKLINISGIVNLNVDVSFKNCAVMLNSTQSTEAKIVVNSGKKLTMSDNTKLDVCTNYLGFGIQVESGGKINIQNSKIRNMFKAIEFLGGSSDIVLKNNIIEKSYIGIFSKGTGANSSDNLVFSTTTPNSFSGNTIEGNITGGLLSKFNSMIFSTLEQSYGFVPDLTSSYDNNSLAGIILHNHTGFKIGANTGNKNIIKDFQNGLCVRNGDYIIENTNFENVNKISTFNSIELGNAIYARNLGPLINTISYNGVTNSEIRISNSKTAIFADGYALNINNLGMSQVEIGLKFIRSSANISMQDVVFKNNNITATNQFILYEDKIGTGSGLPIIDIGYNYCIVSNGSNIPKNSLPAIEFKSNFLTCGTLPLIRNFYNNQVYNYANSIGIKIENICKLDVLVNSILNHGVAINADQFVSSYIKNCKYINELNNFYFGGHFGNGSDLSSLSSQFLGSNIFPAAQVIEDVSESNFECNTYRAKTGLLIKASKANSSNIGNDGTSIKNNNFKGEKYGILIEANTKSSPSNCHTLPQQIKNGNKFYSCYSQLWAIWHKGNTSFSNPVCFTQFGTSQPAASLITNCSIPTSSSAVNNIFRMFPVKTNGSPLMAIGSISSPSITGVMSIVAGAPETAVCYFTTPTIKPQEELPPSMYDCDF